MATNRRARNGVPVFAILLVVLGGLLLLQTTGVVGWRVWVTLVRFWPVLLIVAGLNLWLAGRRPWVAASAIALTLVAIVVGGIIVEGGSASSNGGNGGSLDINAVFGSTTRSLEGQTFSGGKASSAFGSVEIDLRDAVHPGGTVHLELNSVFGSVQVRVPRDWNVEIDGNPVLGSVEDNRFSETAPEGAPRLVIDATAVFGSVQINN